MDRADLMERMATLLKREIGPAVPDAYPKTQAFLGAVVLQKLAAERRLTEAHAEAASLDRKNLLADLEASLAVASGPVREACLRLDSGGDAELCAVIETLYAERGTLDADTFDTILSRIRQDLRRSIDRRMEIAS